MFISYSPTKSILKGSTFVVNCKLRCIDSAVCAKMFSMNYKKIVTLIIGFLQCPLYTTSMTFVNNSLERSSTTSFPKMEFYQTNVENE